MKKFSIVLALVLAVSLLTGCAGSDSPVADDSGVTQIVLDDSGIQITGGGAKAEGSVVTIATVGTYSVSGSLRDGQVVVDTGEETVNVTLILNGVDITNLTGPALQIRQAKNAHVQLAEGTENKLTSGTEADMAQNSDDSSGAALFAEDDLDIDGPGSLLVLGYINNGIACKKDLDINGGNITVLAANNGIRGNNSVDIKGGTISVSAGNDGVKATNAKKEGKGTVAIRGGSLTVTAGGDGISAETELTISDGALFVSTDGDPEQGSSKALKAQTGLVIEGGELRLSAIDHAIRSGAGVTVTGGTIDACSTEGRAIAAHGDIVIEGGKLTLDAKKDGIETPGDITIHGGTMNLSAGDDGLQAGEANSGRGTVTVAGGDVRISAKGQAINARGQIVLDGGTLIALGGSTKAPAPTGSQAFMSVGWAVIGGNEVTAADGEGTVIASTVAQWPFKNILVSAPELVPGETYTLTNGVSSTTVRCPE